MDRNTQERFAMNPVNIDISRSRFPMDPEVKTSFNLGDIIPIGKPIEVLPGDTFQIDTAMAIRMQSLITPPYDNLHFDLYFFFVPNRIVWSHWKEFMGENNESAWIPQTTYTVPTIDFVGGAVPGSIADYMGIPTSLPSTQHIVVNALPIRGYTQCYNDWFRDTNLCPPANLSIDDTNRTSLVSSDSNYGDSIISMELGCTLAKAAKSRDYFTACLPGPQRGPDVMVFDHLPVYADANGVRNADDVVSVHGVSNIGMTVPVMPATNPVTYTNRTLEFNTTSSSPYDALSSAQFNNVYVDGSLTINQLRLAFQIQKLYEKEARSGDRYISLLKGHFGVTAPDASLQRSQYLGGRRISIDINSIYQTSESGTTPQGTPTGYSITGDAAENDVVMSFTEHGYIHCLGVARIDQHTYQQGLHRDWTRKSKLDYYFPVLANIGEQPVKNSEIYAQGLTSSELADINLTNNAVDNQVFGYQEAWAEYRYQPSICTSEMRSNVSNSLDAWHFADDYSQLPSLSKSWIEEDKANIDRSLAVTSVVANQFFGDFHFHIDATRPMPLYSVPGLIDHH